MRRLRDHKESSEPVHRSASHLIDDRLVEVELCTGRRECIVRADCYNHLSAAFCKGAEVWVRCVEVCGELDTPPIQRTALNVIQRIRIHIAHQKSCYSQNSQMRVHGSLSVCALLATESCVGNETAPARVGIRKPHTKSLYGVSERRCESVAAVNKLQCFNLPIRETGSGARVRWIGI